MVKTANLNYKTFHDQFRIYRTGRADFQHWIETDSSIAETIKHLLNEIKKLHFRARANLSLLDTIKGFWFRRITGEHRLVYKVEGKKGVDQSAILFNAGFIMIRVYACKKHCEKQAVR
jgi:toxin YoeB